MALEGDWSLPDPEGLELDLVLGMIRASAGRKDAAFKTFLPKDGSLKRLPAESESAWFKRVNDELKRRKESQKQPGRKPQKAT